MAFMRNVWYVAAWSGELADEPLARTFLDQAVVLFRKADGTPAALEDRCCHRALPLSMGTVTDDGIRCGYHGLKFDESGTCIEVPGQSSVPPDASVRAFPVIEKWGAIWIWIGDSIAADPALIPDTYWLDHPDWTPAPGYLHVDAPYQLLIDNLLDLTHVSYIHKSTLAGDDVEALVQVETKRDKDRLHVGRWIMDVTAPPLYAAGSGISGKVDRWQLITWQAPSFCFFDIGCATTGTGAPEGDRSQGVSMWSTHLITPETETTAHYFFNFVRNYRLDDPDITQLLYEGARATFLEDVEVLEAQHRAMSRRAPQIDINIDNAPLQARRITAELIAAESAPV